MIYDLTDDFPVFIVMAVKEITKENGLFRICLINKVDQRLRILPACCGRNRQTSPSEMKNLSKVEIRNDQDALVCKEQRP